MSYSKFTNLEIKHNFGVSQEFVESLFNHFPQQKPSQLLTEYLNEYVGFALGQGTEKARSEYIIAPVLGEIRKISKNQISVFSGIEFNVDRKQKLVGICDFLISRSPYQTALESPVLAAVEAKRQDFELGINQCLAEMIAARIFNEKNGKPVKKIYGCVTTGDVWRFLVLEDNLAKIETVSFDVRGDLERILGILYGMALGEIDN